MKNLFLGLVLSISSSVFASGLPAIHSIKTVILSAPYSCEGSYEKSAVFLSQHSEDRNSPDLLYNGACGSSKYIEASTAGDDFSLIADLGEVKIEDVTASKAFNFARTVGRDNIFTQTASLKANHTYAVLTSKSDKRSLVIYKVKSISETGDLELEYAVKSYAVQDSVDEVPGFDWSKKNSR